MAKRAYVRASRRIPIEERGFLHGIREIGNYMGMSESSVRKYMRLYGLPIAQRADRRWITTKDLLNQWVAALAGEQFYARQKSKEDRSRDKASE